MFFDSVIFDLDNTLYSYDECHEKALFFVLDKISKLESVSYELCKSIYTKCNSSLKYELNNTASSHSKFISFKLTLEELNSNLDVVEIDKDYWTVFLDSLKLFDHVSEVLQFLKSRNIPIYILTDYTTEHQYKKVDRLGIRNYIKNLISSEEVGLEKPSSKSFLYTLSKMSGKNPIFVGDNFSKDILGANNCGIYGFYFLPSSDFMTGDKYTKFGNFNQLLKFLEKFDDSVTELKVLSKYFGERFDLTQAAGGNISVKFDDIMIIKSSGINLSEVNNQSGYSVIKNSRLNSDVSQGNYHTITNYNLFINRRASMETYMHSFLKTYTIHLHPIQLINILIRKNYKEILQEILPGSLILQYETPGVELSELIKNNWSGEKIILLANHGLIITTDDYDEIVNCLENLLNVCENYIGKDYSRYKVVNKINQITSQSSIICEDKILSTYLENNLFNDSSYFPDKIIFCGDNFLFVDSNLEIELVNYRKKFSTNPKVIIYDKNIYITEKSILKCKDVESVLKAHLMSIEFNCENVTITGEQSNHLSSLDAEKYRKSL